ncbi:MAG: hypothetical protein JWP58_3816 [Hymenobacter sp.]|nr:hypothetical protein [Hymenobacter sp.]
MYRAKYAQQAAVRMYYDQQPVAAVAQMVVAEGAAPEEAEALAREYYASYLFVRTTASRAKRKTANMLIPIGAVVAAGSVSLSFLMYLLIDDGGLIALFKGVVDKRQAEAELKQVQELAVVAPH